jgi:hypothetical protein
MGSSYRKLVDQAHQSKTISEILELPPDALIGVSKADADRLGQIFNIRTVRALAENAFFLNAQVLLNAGRELLHDPGPPPGWQAFWAEAPLADYLEHPSGRFRCEFGPVYYRGRLDGTARVLVIGQDPATDELIAHRCFVGTSGQRLQGLLKKIGLNRSYVIANTFLYPINGQFDAELEQISLEPWLVDFRDAMLNRFIAENPLEAVITMGSAARHAVDYWLGKGDLPVFNLLHPAAAENLVLSGWNEAMQKIQAMVSPDEGMLAGRKPYGSVFTSEDEPPIPRFDLPFGIPEWHGVGGERSKREGTDKIIWMAPAVREA